LAKKLRFLGQELFLRNDILISECCGLCEFISGKTAVPDEL